MTRESIVESSEIYEDGVFKIEEDGGVWDDSKVLKSLWR